MIDIEKEKQSRLSTQELYEVIANSIACAEDEGFLNSFVFERALYVYAATYIYEDKSDKILNEAMLSPLNAWEMLLLDGSIEEMNEKYKDTIDILCACADSWFNEYESYLHSLYSVVDALQAITGKIIGSQEKDINGFINGGEFKALQDISNKWGFGENNVIEMPQAKK